MNSAQQRNEHKKDMKDLTGHRLADKHKQIAHKYTFELSIRSNSKAEKSINVPLSLVAPLN